MVIGVATHNNYSVQDEQNGLMTFLNVPTTGEGLIYYIHIE